MLMRQICEYGNINNEDQQNNKLSAMLESKGGSKI